MRARDVIVASSCYEQCGRCTVSFAPTLHGNGRANKEGKVRRKYSPTIIMPRVCDPRVSRARNCLIIKRCCSKLIKRGNSASRLFVESEESRQLNGMA